MRTNDRRRTCWCGHRYGIHATGGTRCLAVVNDPDRTALIPCLCYGWEPGPIQERDPRSVFDLVRDTEGGQVEP